MSCSRSSQRFSVSPFRSRKGSAPLSSSSTASVAHYSAPKQGGARPTTPSSTSSSSARPSTPSSVSGRQLVSSKMPPVFPDCAPAGDRVDMFKAKESVTVTVRFRPLSAREINKGDEIAWYADGDYTVRNEYNANVAYGFDRVFGPATTTRHIYDVAAQHVVSGAMEGINGTVFAYGVTSSGKTHTMHGEQKSPGIIPLAVKDVFSIIQETPGREFLLRVSYLEIYNEVINDLLDPIGQNLRIREDSQGIYVEGIKEEVVLSPAHALSLIASGEEHRHVGSNNFNLLSSRSHTIFTLTIESSPGEDGDEDVRLSQLNLIDLAGSESSKTETTGLRRKEGSYINKSLLTLGTVIAKLTDGKASHVPYRDSKLTRLLQSSLSGHGRVSLICTVTPASSNTEETHNTLKFAHRSKHVEIKAAPNKILDEKSLIKKYQREISSLKQELQQLKRGMMEKQHLITPDHEDLVNLKMQSLKLEAGQVKLQSRLEEEEQAKAALMGRIQRLTKLILVSTKNTLSSNISERTGRRRRHSFDEDELAYLPDRKREYIIDDDAVSLDFEFSSEGKCDSLSLDELTKLDKRNKNRGKLGWFKMWKPDADNDSSASGSPSCSQSMQQRNLVTDTKTSRRKSVSKRGDDHSSVVDPFSERTQAGDLFSAAVRGWRPPPTGTTISDQMDLLSEQMKMLAGEVALCSSSLKRLSEQAAKNPEDNEIQVQMQKLKDEINEKKLQMRVLEQRMVGSFEASPCATNNLEMSQALSKMTAQLNERTFELEIMSADNRILREQLQLKIAENAEMQETVVMLRQQLDSLLDGNADDLKQGMTFGTGGIDLEDQSCFSGSTPKSLNDYNNSDESCLKSQILMQSSEIENFKQEKIRFAEEKDGLEIHCRKLSEEASYAKELASDAAVELRNLAEEVTRLSYQNAKLAADLAAAKELSSGNEVNNQRNKQFNWNHVYYDSSQPDYTKCSDDASLIEDLQCELMSRCQVEASLNAEILEKDKREVELQKKLGDAKRHEEYLETELANMWVILSKLKRSDISQKETLYGDGFSSQMHSQGPNGSVSSNGFTVKNLKEGFKNGDGTTILEELHISYGSERRRLFTL